MSGVSASQGPLYQYSKCLGCLHFWTGVDVHLLTGNVYSLSNMYPEMSGVSARLVAYVKILTGGVCMSVLLDICTLPALVKPGSVWGVCFDIQSVWSVCVSDWMLRDTG